MSPIPFRRREFLAALPASILLAGSGYADMPGKYYTPEQFGADPTGKRASSIAFISMLETAMADGFPCICDRPGAIYRLDRSVNIQTRGRPVSLRGLGFAKTKILIDGWFTGISIAGAARHEEKVELRDFEITRLNYQSYMGKIGNRSIAVTRAKGVVISGIKESGSIGFGIFVDRCFDYEISRCFVSDHLNGKLHLSGTDGIHIYRSPGPGNVFENTIHDVGDDAISFGSFYSNEPTQNFQCYNNRISNIAGSIKIYGNAQTFRIFDNVVTSPKTGGVIIYDDRNVAQSFKISGGEIQGNIVKGQIGAGIAGGISIWSPTGDGEGIQSNIVIRDNQIEDGNFGITVASQAPNKYSVGVVIANNQIQRIRQRGIMIDRCSGPFSVTGNVVSETGFESAFLGEVQRGGKSADLEFSSNKLSRYAIADRGRYAIKCDPRWSIGSNAVDGPADKRRAP